MKSFFCYDNIISGDNVKIETLVVGSLQENCYICTIGDYSFIVDPGDEAQEIIKACSNKNIKEILVTHYHFDHVGALEELKKHFNLEENVKTSYFDYEVIKTPGHTSDSVSFYFEKEKVLFSGDFIFYGTIGRMDLPTGSEIAMQDSLELISKYPKDTVVYPGHGSKTILGNEVKRFEYYF
ncbi:MBL fold metallo-hydrolase [bacterium]|nr:MBL fold metallo-hydrolase [bacterium]